MKLGYLRISVIYILTSLAWITLSDKFLFLFEGKMDAGLFMALSTLKGYGFVLLSGLLLFKMIKADEERITESENQYRTMYEGNPLPMWIYDLETLKFVSVNQTAINNYGYSKSEFLNKTILDIRPQDDAKQVKSSAIKVSANFRQSGKWTHIKADGMPIDVMISSQQIQLGSKPNIMVIAHDITEKVAFERKLENLNNDLKEEKRKLSETQLTAKVAGWELYLSDKRLVWSDELYIITGIKPDPGKNLFDLYVEHIHPDDRPMMIAGLELLVTTGKQLDVTHRITFPDKGSRYVRQLAGLERLPGLVPKVIGTMQDITELKQMELEKNRYLYSLDDTLNNMSEGFYTLDKDLTFTKVNKKFEHDAGMSSVEIVGKKLRDVFPGIEGRATYQQYQRVLSENTSVRFEAYWRHFKKWHYVTAYPTREGVAVYFNDITDEKEKDIKLKEAVERYEIVGKATLDVIYDYEIPHDHIECNASLVQMLNLPYNQLCGDFAWWKSLIHPEDLNKVLTSRGKVINHKKTNWDCEYRLKSGGNYIYVYDQCYFVYDDAGHVIRQIGAIKNINDLKLSNEENKRLAEIITKVNNMIIVINIENG